MINIYDIENTTTILSNNLKSSYLTALHINQNSILVGDGYGCTFTIDPKTLSIIHKNKIHSDSISGIIEEENCFITVGCDGKVNFTDKRKMEIVKSLEV